MAVISRQIFQYKMVTSLDREEVIRRLKNATVLKGEWVPFRDRENYLFYGEVEEESFMLRINRFRMFPYSPRHAFLPMVQGVMLVGTGGNCGIFFQLKSILNWKNKRKWISVVSVIYLLLWCTALAFFSLCLLISDPLDGIVWILFCCMMWGLGELLKRMIWKHAGKCLLKWFEELWDAKEVI